MSMPASVSTSSADRLLAVLQLFTPERPEWTVETAANEIGVTVSTAYRYFRSLCRIGLLDPYAGGSYVLGPAIVEFDRQIRIGDPLIKVAGSAGLVLGIKSPRLGASTAACLVGYYAAAVVFHGRAGDHPVAWLPAIGFGATAAAALVTFYVPAIADA